MKHRNTKALSYSTDIPCLKCCSKAFLAGAYSVCLARPRMHCEWRAAQRNPDVPTCRISPQAFTATCTSILAACSALPLIENIRGVLGRLAARLPNSKGPLRSLVSIKFYSTFSSKKIRDTRAVIVFPFFRIPRSRKELFCYGNKIRGSR